MVGGVESVGPLGFLVETLLFYQDSSMPRCLSSCMLAQSAPSALILIHASTEASPNLVAKGWKSAAAVLHPASQHLLM